jgi:outer membrane receptor protein involved in Fe transport
MPLPSSDVFKRSALYLAISSTLIFSQSTVAEQNTLDSVEHIEVTGSRRLSTIQTAPINIAALNNDFIEQQNISTLTDIARWIPGLTIAEQGGRYDAPLIVRGLNLNNSGPVSDGGTVAIYIGEQPLNIDMKIIDVDRVEVLIGPQGTLYGASTLGGAIRYLPNKPVLDEMSASVYGDVFGLAHSDDLGKEAGFVVNLPIIDNNLALRAALNYEDAPGFIDYGYTVKEIGTSLPDPDWNNAVEVDDNIQRVNDANSSKTTTARVTLRWQPSENFDANLSYFYQKEELNGFSISHYNTLAETHPLTDQIGKYESAYRLTEPREKESSLVSLELVANLGFAELTSATGISEYDAKDFRDQTDILIIAGTGYEEIPYFTGFAQDVDKNDGITQEFRLVSTDDTAVSWIAGVFYNKQKFFQDAREFAPNVDDYYVELGFTDQTRDDDLELISHSQNKSTEKALYGEVNIEITDKLNFTFGGRHYRHHTTYAAATDFPLYYTMFEGAGSDEVFLPLEDRTTKDTGNLFKLNADYQFTPDLLSYLTISEGYRAGGSNGLPICSDDIINACASANLVTYQEEKTVNYELGLKSSWLNNRYHFNAAVFKIDWEDAQVGDFTDDFIPIFVNAGQAKSVGLELSSKARLNNHLSAYLNYAYTKAELTQDAELLSAFDGDRLPGSPKNQFALGINYQTNVAKNLQLDMHYGLTYQSNVNSALNTEKNEVLSGYALNNLSAVLSDEQWKVTFYIDNLFDKYAFSSIRGTQESNDDIIRYYGHYLITPRTAGIKFNYLFDL